MRHAFPRVAALALLVTCALVLLGPSEALAQGCAMCGTAVSSAKDPLGRGLALSIAFMLTAPNLLVASIGGWLFYVYRRASRGSPGEPGPSQAPLNLPSAGERK